MGRSGALPLRYIHLTQKLYHKGASQPGTRPKGGLKLRRFKAALTQRKPQRSRDYYNSPCLTNTTQARVNVSITNACL